MIEMLKEYEGSAEKYFDVYKPATDFDGIICDLRTLAVNEFNDRCGTDYSTFDIRCFGQVIVWAKKLGMSHGEALKIEEELWYKPDFIRKASPVEGAVDFLNWFSERGIKMPIITTRRPNLREITYNWLEEWTPSFPREDVFIRPAVMCDMSGDIYKAYMVRFLGIDVFFEDIVEQAKVVLDYTDANVILHSNLEYLDRLYQGRLLRFPEIEGVGPSMRKVNDELLNISTSHNVDNTRIAL